MFWMNIVPVIDLQLIHLLPHSDPWRKTPAAPQPCTEKQVKKMDEHPRTGGRSLGSGWRFCTRVGINAAVNELHHWVQLTASQSIVKTGHPVPKIKCFEWLFTRIYNLCNISVQCLETTTACVSWATQINWSEFSLIDLNVVGFLCFLVQEVNELNRNRLDTVSNWAFFFFHSCGLCFFVSCVFGTQTWPRSRGKRSGARWSICSKVGVFPHLCDLKPRLLSQKQDSCCLGGVLNSHFTFLVAN